MQKEILVCHFNGLHVEEVFKTLNKSDRWAHTAIRALNAYMVANGGDLANECWFINEKIKAKSTIITLGPDNDILKDDQGILNRLGQYVNKKVSLEHDKDGDFNKIRHNK